MTRKQRKKSAKRFFDGFTFRTFGGNFEAIFDKKRAMRQFFDGFYAYQLDGFTFRTFGGIFEAIFYEKKVVRQFFLSWKTEHEELF